MGNDGIGIWNDGIWIADRLEPGGDKSVTGSGAESSSDRIRQ